MKIIIIGVLMLLTINIYSKNIQTDTLIFKKSDIIVTSTRIGIPFINVPSSASLIGHEVLDFMSRGIAVDEALRLTPGVRIDNQANGERVHMSIRGQGILSERGLRGIKVIIDDIPVNDPSGFAADLYDIDWGIVDKIEILRGPQASYYGSSGAAGVLNIFTKNGESGGIGGFSKEFSFTGGSNGFIKVLGSLGGQNENLNYRISFSKNMGDGYRQHTGFWGDNLSEKINWTTNDKFSLTQIFMSTDFFNQNAEGLSIDQVNQDPKQANPDAIPFNEYQKTNRITNGLSGMVKFSDMHDLQFTGFLRLTKYKETSNKAAQYRDFTAPGGSLQYNLHVAGENIKHNIGVGTEFQWQTIAEHKFKSLNDTTRKDNGTDDANIEDPTVLANQNINQNLLGAFAFYNLELLKKVFFNASVRYDKIHNELNDKLNHIDSINFSGSMDFDKVTGKIGASYSIMDDLSVFANWGTAFIPPATEELASNPLSFGGFNKSLVPATSISQEIGFRGFPGNFISYDITAFYMTTDHDFFRFKLYPARGNQEVFYGNAGSSKRYGVETFINIKPFENLNIQIAYTYSNFKYDSPDSLKDVWVPNSPEHQLSLDIQYNIIKDLSIGVNSDIQSKWYIYADAEHKNLSQDGFALYGARAEYKLNLFGVDGIIGIYAKNLTDTKYIAFTEPDPDGNSYQPGSGREFFGTIKIKF
jgi:iron complex outermembrane recepter protein